MLVPLVFWSFATLAAASDTSFDPDGTCDGDEPANVKCAIVAGPGSITHKSLFSLGLGICTDTGLPLACDATPGALAGAGAAIFNVSDWVAGNHRVDLWVEHIPGAVPCLPATEVCGFDISLCNDRDLDNTCTNVGDDSDQLFDAESNEPIVGADCTDDKKDEKDCGDDLDASINDKCLAPAEQPPGTADWNFGQIVVFIGAWIDNHPNDPNIGAGISAGSYEVWLEDFGAGDPACVPSENDIFGHNTPLVPEGPPLGCGETFVLDNDETTIPCVVQCEDVFARLHVDVAGPAGAFVDGEIYCGDDLVGFCRATVGLLNPCHSAKETAIGPLKCIIAGRGGGALAGNAFCEDP